MNLGAVVLFCSLHRSRVEVAGLAKCLDCHRIFHQRIQRFARRIYRAFIVGIAECVGKSTRGKSLVLCRRATVGKYGLALPVCLGGSLQSLDAFVEFHVVVIGIDDGKYLIPLINGRILSAFGVIFLDFAANVGKRGIIAVPMCRQFVAPTYLLCDSCRNSTYCNRLPAAILDFFLSDAARFRSIRTN